MGFPGDSDGKESPCNAGDPGSFSLHGYTTYCLSIYQLVDFGVVFVCLFIVRNAAVNICVQVFMRVFVIILLRFIFRGRIARSGDPVFHFLCNR